MFSLLIFMFCFFLGFIAMFLYSLKKRESYFKSLNDEHAQLRVLLRAMESRLDHMEKYLGLCAGLGNTHFQADKEMPAEKASAEMKGTGGHDPLLHLSFEEPCKKSVSKTDPALDLLLDTESEKNKA